LQWQISLKVAIVRRFERTRQHGPNLFHFAAFQAFS
jgi:hypothetical protein